MSQSFVITGTGTDVGKTVFAAALTRALDAHYWKPVQAGLDGPTDSETVAMLGRLPRERILPEAYRLQTPCSPHRAAEIDGIEIGSTELRVPAVAPLVIEGAGGVLVPLGRGLLIIDVFAEWGLPVILVASTVVGTINHSLLSIEALRRREVPVLGVAFVGSSVPDSEAIICKLGRVRRLGRLPILPTLHGEQLDAAFAANFELRDFA